MAVAPDDLDKLLKKAFEAEPVPDFDETWRSAKAKLKTGKRDRISSRLVWISAAAVGAAAVAAVVLNLPEEGLGEDDRPAVATRRGGDVLQLLSGLEDPEIKIITLDEFDTDWSAEDSAQGKEDNTDSEQEAEITSNTLGQGMFESPTDFLLDFKIPEWNGRSEKGVSDEDS